MATELNPTTASRLIRQHFNEVGSEEFGERIERALPGYGDSSVEQSQRDPDSEELPLFQPNPAHLPLQAYLACALSGLDQDQRQLVFQISDTVAQVCSNVGIELYEPRKKTDPVHHEDVPDSEVFETDRSRVQESDLLIHLTHFPSTGSGQELDFAYNALVPVVLVKHASYTVSRMITGIPSLQLEIDYTEPEELRSSLEKSLRDIRPLLEERKLAFADYDVNVVGNNIRLVRESRGLTRSDVASQIGLLTDDGLRQCEESVDRVSNPSLVLLRQLAAVLSTTVADLVEPDANDRLVTLFDDLLAGRVASRFDNLSERDREQAIRRLCYRILDSLDSPDHSDRP